MTGILIVLEGVDHSGKTTQRELLAKSLRDAGHDVVVTREPGGTPYAERIRDLALFPETDEAIDPLTELLLMSAARVQHINQVIKPSLEAGKIVICDRFVLSTFAYQVFPHVSEGNTRMADVFYGLMPYVLGEIQEPVTFFLNLPVEARKERAAKRGKEVNHLDLRDDDFYAKVNEALELGTQTPGCITINADRPVDDIAAEMFKAVTDYMKRLKEAQVAQAADVNTTAPADQEPNA